MVARQEIALPGARSFCGLRTDSPLPSLAASRSEALTAYPSIDALSKGGSGNGHYGGKAEVYMDVGEAMGKAMVEMLKGAK